MRSLRTMSWKAIFSSSSSRAASKFGSRNRVEGGGVEGPRRRVAAGADTANAVAAAEEANQDNDDNEDDGGAVVNGELVGDLGGKASRWLWKLKSAPSVVSPTM
jgi:hypothetical protein